MIRRECLFCKKVFYEKPYRIKLGRGKYCSRKCVYGDKKRRPTTRCKYCGVEFETWNCVLKRGGAKYCSRNCAFKARRGENHPNWQGGKPTLVCIVCGKEFQSYLDRRRKERRICSKSCLNKWQETSLRGKNNPNWKDGISTENNIIRTSTEYERWKTMVFKRDDYTCQLCGIRGGDLNAHHILSFRDFPEYRLDVSNGITHHEECHDIITSILAMGDIFQPLPQLNA